MDPQCRQLLEVAFETFESGGFPRDWLVGSETGVFVSQSSHDYHHNNNNPSSKITANRISGCFHLKGPSITIDSGGSSSIIALHQAVQSIRSGESQQCLVAGVDLLLDPNRFVALHRSKRLFGAGRCGPVDHRGSGYGRGEGIAAVLLKPLDNALRDGNPIRAVIRHSVVNHDGNTDALTAQKEVIQKAYSLIGLRTEPDYVEFNGTGSLVDDLVSIQLDTGIRGRLDNNFGSFCSFPDGNRSRLGYIRRKSRRISPSYCGIGRD
jgi:acyl transferase domain-containing protein